ncbi:hypothetical protein L6164_018134 [Bauhinia variegata]|uniref:Uncharacterized protein n=1 Tax=Bauhinia variegata TaxID=167791 RepID=A0ACB9NAS0_BAUVA|nr:hypothetical protein L6164_018134 [Bauhinia variegata]
MSSSQESVARKENIRSDEEPVRCIKHHDEGNGSLTRNKHRPFYLVVKQKQENLSKVITGRDNWSNLL